MTVYFLINRVASKSASTLWLVMASLFFYGYWSVNYLALIIISMVCNFSIGKSLYRTKQAGRQSLNRKLMLLLGLLFNVGLLAYYKYSDFIIANVNHVFETNTPLLNVLLPLAISFFTFQQIAYLVDCYKASTQEYNLLNYGLFVTFFPQLIAGPIVHHKEMMPQFNNIKNSRFNIGNVSKGVYIFAIGLFKKVAIADTFAIWANEGYDQITRTAGNSLSILDAWQTSLSYTFQLYYDFSAYSDMAIGAALMFNIVLPINFNSPYKALNIQEFWHRWHITLSRWLRDYVYIPLGGSYKGATATYINLMLTFIIGGLWHGAAWTFIVWGLLHGCAIVIHRVWQNRGASLPIFVAWPVTFMFINITWVVFRAENMEIAINVIQSMVGLNGVNLVYAQTTPIPLIVMVLCAYIAFRAKNTMEIAMSKQAYCIKDGAWVGVTLFLSIVLGINSTSAEFLYFNF
ncbi:MAG: MBOAT family protein [Cycloclasticus sp.]